MTAQLSHSDEAEHRRQLAVEINQLLNGRVNSTGSVTLTASVSTTTVQDKRVGDTSVILFMPATVNAATEFGAGTMYVSTITAGTSFVITHVNNAQADRTFRYLWRATFLD